MSLLCTHSIGSVSLPYRGLCIRKQRSSRPAGRLSGLTSARQPPGGARAAPGAAAGGVRRGCPGGHGTAPAPLQLLGAARLRCCVGGGALPPSERLRGGCSSPKRRKGAVRARGVFGSWRAPSGNSELVSELVETAKCYPLRPRLSLRL